MNMTTGRHRDLSGLYRDIEDVVKEEGPLTTAKLKEKLWEKGYKNQYKSLGSFHRTLGYQREKVEENTDVITRKVEPSESEGSMKPWEWKVEE